MKKTFKNNEVTIKLNKKAYKEAYKEMCSALVDQFKVSYGITENAWLEGTPVQVKNGKLTTKEDMECDIYQIKNDTITKARFVFKHNGIYYCVKYTRNSGFKIPKALLNSYFTEDVNYFGFHYDAEVIINNNPKIA